MTDQVDELLPSLGADETPQRMARCFLVIRTLVSVERIIDGEGRELEPGKERKEIVKVKDVTGTLVLVCEWFR